MKFFYVVKPYDEYKWEITTETKIINGFNCYKTATVKKQFDEVRNFIRRF